MTLAALMRLLGLRSLVWRHIHLALGWALVVGSERCCDPM